MGIMEGLVAIIGDEDTVTGFVLAGIGHREGGKSNVLVVDQKEKREEIEIAFKEFTERNDISIILITQVIATQIRDLIQGYDKIIPTILEIPSKDVEYDEKKDPVMMRVLRLMGRAV